MAEPKMPGWLSDMGPARVWVQAGFAGIVALVFLFLVWVTISQLQALQLSSHEQMQALQRQLSDTARDDRAMFRDELKSQREELRAAVAEMRRAVDRLDTGHQRLKQDVDTLKYGGQDAFRAPVPRAKP
jgi:hypothetical protein